MFAPFPQTVRRTSGLIEGLSGLKTVIRRRRPHSISHVCTIGRGTTALYQLLVPRSSHWLAQGSAVSQWSSRRQQPQPDQTDQTTKLRPILPTRRVAPPGLRRWVSIHPQDWLGVFRCPFSLRTERRALSQPVNPGDLCGARSGVFVPPRSTDILGVPGLRLNADLEPCEAAIGASEQA